MNELFSSLSNQISCAITKRHLFAVFEKERVKNRV